MAPKEGPTQSGSTAVERAIMQLKKEFPEEAPPRMGQNYKGVLGDDFESLPLLKRLNWIHVPLLTITPMLAIYGLWTTEKFVWQTWAFAVVYYFATGLGITAGYHRLFAHQAYKATAPLRALMLLLGAGAVEGSAKWWSRGHRTHHKYVDTEKDPYAATRGFAYAHIGWMLVKENRERIGSANISDLTADWMIRVQHRFYPLFAIFMAVVLPTLVAHYGWNDAHGGYFIAGVARLVFVHHSTFFVNSLAHYAGDATYTDSHTARNSIITALLTIGEGYHNFHHEFPADYRNGVEWWQYDPTKWFIRTCAFLGLAYDLRRFPSNEIVKGQLQMQQKALDAAKRTLNWGPDPDALKLYTRKEFESKVADGGKQWAILDGFVLDLEHFAEQHPGGADLITSRIGKDISEEFRGTYYKHSNAARNLQATMRVGRIQGYFN